MSFLNGELRASPAPRIRWACERSGESRRGRSWPGKRSRAFFVTLIEKADGPPYLEVNQWQQVHCSRLLPRFAVRTLLDAGRTLEAPRDPFTSGAIRPSPFQNILSIQPKPREHYTQTFGTVCSPCDCGEISLPRVGAGKDNLRLPKRNNSRGEDGESSSQH